ncbi:Protein CBG05848 [Trichuris trichiura]|uniref:Protein CBG05848 n=1 Tax=Trichuris trichiura TaxID=36087 RepID=A0A077YWH8_TRITR|nr:Protein CBG05848 [Trichuris trichiura]
MAEWQNSSATVPVNGNLTERDTCSYELLEFLEVKFWLILVAGSVIYLFGMVTNLMLLVVLLKPSIRNTYLIYLGALCLSDIGILVTFFLIFPVQVLYDYFNLEWMYFLWLRYVPYLYTLSRILTVASTYLVVVCSAERYMEVMQVGYRKCMYMRISQHNRYWIIMAVFLFSTSFRIISLWDLQLVEKPDCTGFASSELQLTELARNPLYQKFYQLWLVHIVQVSMNRLFHYFNCIKALDPPVQVFVPFFTLIVVNQLTIVNWRGVLNKTVEEDGDSNSDVVHSSQTARKMMISIVSSYLVTNLLNLVVTIWEHINMKFLRNHPEFYSFATDAVSLLTITNASLRLPIYYASNWKIRVELKRCCRTMGCQKGQSSVPAVQGERCLLVPLNNGFEQQKSELNQNSYKL